jgi:hypothetical protein
MAAKACPKAGRSLITADSGGSHDARVRLWRDKPLVSHQAIVNLIAATTTKTGLRVRAEVDPGQYPKGVKVSGKEVATIRLERDKFHGEGNYTMLPRPI